MGVVEVTILFGENKKQIKKTYNYRLSNGNQGTTNLNKKDFEKVLKKGIYIKKWFLTWNDNSL